jgi:hypothetical protein
MKIDISALLGGNIYDRLRSRNEQGKLRFSKERNADQALAERQKYLAEIADDIPLEVLKSLPSPEELARQAEATAAKARAAFSGPPK